MLHHNLVGYLHFCSSRAAASDIRVISTQQRSLTFNVFVLVYSVRIPVSTQFRFCPQSHVRGRTAKTLLLCKDELQKTMRSCNPFENEKARIFKWKLLLYVNNIVVQENSLIVLTCWINQLSWDSTNLPHWLYWGRKSGQWDTNTVLS